MNYSDNPGHCLVTRFKRSGKYYDQFQIDMTNYYDELNIYDAVARAIKASHNGHYKITEDWIYVCLEPYHKNSYPVMIVGVPNGT